MGIYVSSAIKTRLLVKPEQKARAQHQQWRKTLGVEQVAGWTYFSYFAFLPNHTKMPVEIRELVIKAMVALDWENKTVNETEENIVCLRLPGDKAIATYVNEYFMQH